MRRLPSLSLLLIPLFLAGCEAEDDGTVANAPVVVDADADEAAIGELRDAWKRGALAGDPAAVGALYADDARMVGPSGELSEGRQAIEGAFMFEGLSGLEIESTDTNVGAELASDMGTFTQTFQGPDGQEQTVTGRYLVVLERQDDGSWKLVQHLAAADPGSMPGAGADTAADAM